MIRFSGRKYVKHKMKKEMPSGEQPESSGKIGKSTPEVKKLFSTTNSENKRLRPRRPRIKPGDKGLTESSGRSSSPSESRNERTVYDRSNFSFGDRGDMTPGPFNRTGKKPYRNDQRPGYGKNKPSGYRRNDTGYNRDNPRSRSNGEVDGNRYTPGESREFRQRDYPRDRDTNSSTPGDRSPARGNFRKDSWTKPGQGARKPDRIFKKPVRLKKSKPREEVPVKREFNDAGEMRLNRYLAHAGICSRRQADDYIKAGLVSVNGTVITEMGVKIKKGDDVRYNGERIGTEKKVYILLNKPKGYVTTTEDEMGRKTVLDLVTDAGPERLYPVGRLDRNTTGVMLLTNDGDLAGKLTHPKYNKKKIYHVVLDKNLKQTDLRSIEKGITLDDGLIQPDAISIVGPDKKNEIGIEIHSGRNRIVRRIFEQLGYEVVRLDRVYFAGLTKKNLARGKWRFLSEKEINLLQMNSFE